jgi:hypothetical protein
MVEFLVINATSHAILPIVALGSRQNIIVMDVSKSDLTVLA